MKLKLRPPWWCWLAVRSARVRSCPERRLPRSAAPKVDQLVVFRSGSAVVEDRCGPTRRPSGRPAPLRRRRAPRRLPRSCARSRARSACATSAPARSGPPTAAGCSCARSARTRNKGKERLGLQGRPQARRRPARPIPSGPFGAGRLRAGQRVTWFYCALENRSCQRTLELSAAAEGGGVAAGDRSRLRRQRQGHRRRRGDRARRRRRARSPSADGVATLTLAPGTVRVHATPGRARSARSPNG